MTLVNASNVLLVQQLLTEYGAAIRGSWADIDGRTVRYDLEDLAASLTTEENADVAHWRQRLGICPNGSGHWLEFCDEDCGTKR